jgi:7-cyano-7-deazaguanine synthase
VKVDRALVLFSGGQDSTTCLAWALARFGHVETIGFDYGQRHRVELECRETILHNIGVDFPAWRPVLRDDHVLRIPVLAEISDTALTGDAVIALAANGLPNTFVPGRNLLFLTLAAAVAYRRGLNVLVGGMCETDFSGYPDCRDNSLKAMALALCLGMEMPFRLETPLMWLDKAAIWRLAAELGGQGFSELVRAQTHTCYLGVREELHSWGYGCGTCPACDLRAKGYERWTEST